MLERLDHGVKLANAAGTRRGDPYLTFLGSLAPRKQAAVEVRFEVQRHGHHHKHDRERHDRDHDDDIDYQVRVFSGLFE